MLVKGYIFSYVGWIYSVRYNLRDFSGDPVVRLHASSAGGKSLIPGQEDSKPYRAAKKKIKKRCNLTAW